MIALDTTILLHARRQELPHHRRARKLLVDLAVGDDPWAIPWPCVYEFLRVVTHPKVFDPPTDLRRAVEDLVDLFECPSLRLLGEGPAPPAHFRRSVLALDARPRLRQFAGVKAVDPFHQSP